MTTQTKPMIQCPVTSQSWWSQKCPAATCDHSLLAHRTRDVWVLPDGTELIQPLGEPVEVPEGSVKHQVSECSTCNLTAAFGELYTAIGGMASMFSDLAQKYREGQAKAQDKIDELIASEVAETDGSWPADPEASA